MQATIKQICQDQWDAHKSDCSGFVHAVSAALGVGLTGQANGMIDTMGRMPWTQLGADAATAARYVNMDYLVIAGLKASGHGHVAIVVPSTPSKPLRGYWGSLYAIGGEDKKISFSWIPADLARVQYFAIKPVAT